MNFNIDFFEKNLQRVNDNHLELSDSLGGFNEDYFSIYLDESVNFARKNNIKTISTAYIFNDQIRSRYPDIEFSYKLKLIGGRGWELLTSYSKHPVIDIENFLSTFNGSPHVSRKLLVAVLNKFGWFNPRSCSKNFTYSVDEIDGHIIDYVGDRDIFYRKFFIPQNNDEFHSTIYNINQYSLDQKFTLGSIYSVEKQLTKSFLHIVSETMATSYYPFVTEKVLFPIITRGLFLAWAPYNYHNYFEKHYGFKKYTKLFDYEFDEIKNPIERLVELISMISKFSVLSLDDWQDLYLLEQDSIEYNYDHYFSQNYLKHLEKFC